MNENALNYLLNLPVNEQGPVGRKIQNFIVQVVENNDQDFQCLNSVFSRQDLSELVMNQDCDNIMACLAIFAWGGMRVNHAKSFIRNWNNVSGIIEKLRTNQFETRSQAFMAFQQLRLNRQMSGVGIAFFTKLICFLQPQLGGYILDQWTARSTNFLFCDKYIYLRNNKWVTDNNTYVEYEIFCQRIENLAYQTNITPIQMEIQLFSRGGLEPLPWRLYLLNNEN